MNPYLTQKSTKSHTGRIVVTALCIFVAAVALVAAVDFIREKNWSTACVELAMVILLLYPAYRNIRHMVRSNDARQLARHLAQRAEERVSLEAFMRDTGKPRLAKKLNRLIGYGYLQNVRVDA